MKKTIVLLPGDGIGPEVTRAAATILRESAHEFNHQFEFQELPIGGAAIDSTGKPLPNETLDACRKADAVFLGAVGGPKWDSLQVGKRPESGLLELRKGLGLFVNLRPVKLLEPLRGISPLKPERLGDLDLEIVRVHACGEPVAAAVLRGQSERLVKLAALAAHRDGDERGLSFDKVRAHVCRQCGDAVDAAALAI